MTIPGILSGGDTSVWRRPTGQSLSNTGVFGKFPGATPKYALNNGERAYGDHQETMARLFVDIPENRRASFYRSLPESTRPIAEALLRDGVGYVDFLLQRTAENLQEKEQVVETLSDNYVAFYTGHSAPVFQYGGTLLNTYQDDQRVWFQHLYTQVLRGSRLAARNLVLRLRYDSFNITGYMMNLQTSLDSSGEMASPFSFAMRVKQFEVFTSLHSLPSDGVINATSRATTVTTEATPRQAVVAPNTPPTATTGPGGAVNLSAAQVRSALTEQGLTGVAAEALVALATTQQAEATGVDPREAAYAQTQEGLDLAVARANPENLRQDGEDGASNVYGI